MANELSQRLRHGLGSDAEFLEDCIAWGADTKAINGNDLTLSANVFPPEPGDAGFDSDALGAAGGEDAFTILGALTFKAFKAGQAHDADAGLTFGTFDSPLHFRAGGDDNGFERRGFLHEHVAAS